MLTALIERYNMRIRTTPGLPSILRASFSPRTLEYWKAIARLLHGALPLKFLRQASALLLSRLRLSSTRSSGLLTP